MLRVYITALLVMAMLSASAQEPLILSRRSEFGLELQAYPAGFIPSLFLTIPQSYTWSWNFRLGLNLTDRKDFSPVNDHEEGKGYGGSVGIQKHVMVNKGEFRFGLNTDIWKMNINWENDQNLPSATSGKTDIVILQPWLHGKYLYPLRSTRFALSAGIGLGREINIVTKGKEVAQGWMGSLLLDVVFRM